MRDRSPCFRLKMESIAWEVADVISINEAGLRTFCAGFSAWNRFLASTVFSHPFLPVLPARYNTGERESMLFIDMVVWKGKWMMLEPDVLVTVVEVTVHEGACRWVLESMSHLEGSEQSCT